MSNISRKRLSNSPKFGESKKPKLDKTLAIETAQKFKSQKPKSATLPSKNSNINVKLTRDEIPKSPEITKNVIDPEPKATVRSVLSLVAESSSDCIPSLEMISDLPTSQTKGIDKKTIDGKNSEEISTESNPPDEPELEEFQELNPSPPAQPPTKNAEAEKLERFARLDKLSKEIEIEVKKIVDEDKKRIHQDLANKIIDMRANGKSKYAEIELEAQNMVKEYQRRSLLSKGWVLSPHRYS